MYENYWSFLSHEIKNWQFPANGAMAIGRTDLVPGAGGTDVRDALARDNRPTGEAVFQAERLRVRIPGCAFRSYLLTAFSAKPRQGIRAAVRARKPVREDGIASRSRDKEPLR